MSRIALRALAAAVATIGLAGLALSQTAQIDNAWMSDQELRKQFSNTTIDGRYASGKAFTESYRTDGTLSYIEPGVTLGGRWSIREGTFCTIYDTDAAGGCFRVSRAGPNCFEFYFVARTEDTVPAPSEGAPRWTARGAVQGAPTACRDAPSV